MRQRFEWALSALRDGRSVRRAGWRRKIAYCWCDGTPLEKRLLDIWPSGTAFAWRPEQSDLLAVDWELAE